MSVNTTWEKVRAGGAARGPCGPCGASGGLSMLRFGLPANVERVIMKRRWLGLTEDARCHRRAAVSTKRLPVVAVTLVLRIR